MDINNLKGLMEAYMQVDSHQEDISEAVKGQSTSMRRIASQERAAERKSRGGAAPKIPGREGPSAGKSYADYQQVSIAAHDKATKKNKNVVGLVTKEDCDVFDTVLEFLCVEGFAETLEEAEWMMANELDAEDIQAIIEGSYEDRIAANNKKYDANRKRAAQRAAARNDARSQGKTGAVPGVGYVTPRKEKETYTDSSGKTRHAKGL